MQARDRRQVIPSALLDGVGLDLFLLKLRLTLLLLAFALSGVVNALSNHLERNLLRLDSIVIRVGEADQVGQRVKTVGEDRRVGDQKLEEREDQI